MRAFFLSYPSFMLGFISFRRQEVVDAVPDIAVQSRLESQSCGQCPNPGTREIAVGHAENPNWLVLCCLQIIFTMAAST